MRDFKSVTDSVAIFREEVNKSCDVLKEVNTDRIKDILNFKGDDLQPNVDAIASLVDDIVICITGSSQAISVPAIIHSLRAFGEDRVSYIKLTVKTRLKAEHPVKRVFDIDINDSLFDNIAQGVFNALLDIYYTEVAGENLKEVNLYLSDLYEANEINNKIFFTLEDSDAIVTYIDESVVYFNADLEKALDVSSLQLFSGDEFLENLALPSLVTSLQSAQSTPDLVKINTELVDFLVGRSKRRVDSILRATFKRKAENLSSLKSGVGYISKDVEIDGSEVKVFALIEKSVDGELNVLLPPFDVTTNLYVDVDALSLVG